MANVFSAQARYAGAERLFKRAREIREKLLGPDDPLAAARIPGAHNLAFS